MNVTSLMHNTAVLSFFSRDRIIGEQSYLQTQQTVPRSHRKGTLGGKQIFAQYLVEWILILVT